MLPLAITAVDGPSMLPTLRPGDVVLLRRGGAHTAGQIAVLRDPKGTWIIKRLVRKVDPTLDGRPGGWWVEGDNAPGSTDSRHFGVVPEDRIEARAVLRIWPPHRVGRPAAQH